MSNNLTSNNFYSSSKEVDELDLGKIFRLILMQSKLIILVTLIAFILSFINYSLATKKYMIQSLLQYEALNQSIFDPTQAIQMASRNSSSEFGNLTSLYESRTNFLRLIKDLKLNINIIDLENDEHIDINIISDKGNDFERYKLKFNFSENGYTLNDENQNIVKTLKYGEQIVYSGLTISVESIDLKKYRPIDIYYTAPESLYPIFKALINVDANSTRNSFFRNEGLITVSYVSDDIDLGKEIINYANNIFINQRIYEETEKSRKAINFIDNNLRSIEESVEFNKVRLKKFREKNQSIDVGLEIEGIIKKIQLLDESLSSIDIELSKAQEIYTANNPVYLNLLNKKNLIKKQKDEVLSEIEMMPKEQQEYIDLFNELEVSQTLLGELESRRLGFSILEASTIGDIRVIDDAYVVSLVSPKIFTVLVATLISLIIACFIAIIRGLHFLPISNPAEIFDNNIHLPILGVIPEVDDFSIQKEDLRLNTSLESLIVNINSIKGENSNQKILTITSPSPFNGKSTLSMKLAEGLAKIGKRVLLVDNDLKRGKIAKNYNIRSISENKFHSIDESTIDTYMVYDNFYIIPRVKGLTNTFQFLYSQQYKEKIKFFRDYFDFIIFDTGPILSVADSSLLVDQSDLNLLVVRHGINRMNEIRQSIDNFKQINKDIDGIIYNAYSKPQSYYGYYGLFGDYSYQYYADKYLDSTYEYEKD